MSAFYFGETLQASTTSALSEISRNFSLHSVKNSNNTSDAPAMIIAYFFFSGI